MNVFRKIVAAISAVLMTATLMGLPDLSMAQGVTVTAIHTALVIARS
jgi:hypothetical protein